MARKIGYCCIHYNEEEDSFELWIRRKDEKEWGFSRSSKCRVVNDGDEPTHIHFSMLTELVRCVDLGFELVPNRNW